MKIIALFILVFLSSCSGDFLDVKPDKSQVVPTTLQDLQVLLNNDQMNKSTPGFGEVASDDKYIDSESWNALVSFSRNAYIWKDDLLIEDEINDWSLSYIPIYYANIALEGVAKIVPDPGTQKDWNLVKGSALFFRSFRFFHLAQVFTLPYDPATAESELGLPLRLDPDPNKKSVRSTLSETYGRIIRDANEAVNLLPVDQEYKTRPSRAAVYGLLARVYLSMSDYKNAGLYADSALQLFSTLINYNTLELSKQNPFVQFNDEVMFHDELATYIRQIRGARVDSTLYSSYDDNDLRKEAFFDLNENSTVSYYGSYTGITSFFSGIASDEMYLIRAECAARAGKVDAAMDDLNLLLQNRWKAGTFNPLSASNSQEALDLILRERRKELAFRGLRWMDLRRLNREPRYAVTLTRKIDGKTYTLEPGSFKYAFLIPQAAIIASGMEQNRR